jgi:hypothetical protein
LSKSSLADFDHRNVYEIGSMNIFGILDPFFKALSDGKLIRLTAA